MAQQVETCEDGDADDWNEEAAYCHVDYPEKMPAIIKNSRQRKTGLGRSLCADYGLGRGPPGIDDVLDCDEEP